ncbi:MAG: hypothetical protein HYZ72_19760 [Deltaproteobacteria bacterium]|nr:hypothetical protein [Deltaproteobacteria bacterium]
MTIEDRTAELAALHAEVFGKHQKKSQEQAGTGGEHANGYTRRKTCWQRVNRLLEVAEKLYDVQGEWLAKLEARRAEVLRQRQQLRDVPQRGSPQP